MNGDEARVLAQKIANTWRGGPTIDVWIDALQRLDAGTAGTAYIRLQDDLEHPPSIKAFRSACSKLHTASSEERCPDCGNDGWITASPFTKHGIEYSAVKPCTHCEHGRMAARWYHQQPDRPVTHNGPTPVTENAPVIDLFTGATT